MIDINNQSISTGEPVRAPAPEETTPATTPAITTPADAALSAMVSAHTVSATVPTSATLPDGYLANGYFRGAGKARYADPDLVGPTAEEIAKALASGGLKLAGYNQILRELKKVNKKVLPLDAKVGALAGAMVKAKLLEQRKRAPHLLAEVLERNCAAVQNTADPDVYRVVYQHLEAVGAYLGDFQE